jgi:hypothetical protein
LTLKPTRASKSTDGEREREKEKGEGTRGLVRRPGLHTVVLGDLRHLTRGPEPWSWSRTGGITHWRSLAPLLRLASRTVLITTNPLVWSLSLGSLANFGGVESRGGGNYSSLGRELHTGVHPASVVVIRHGCEARHVNRLPAVGLRVQGGSGGCARASNHGIRARGRRTMGIGVQLRRGVVSAALPRWAEVGGNLRIVRSTLGGLD